MLIEPPSPLPRVLGPWMAAAIVVGTVIGSGVFKKPQYVAERVPEFGPAMLVWVLGGVLALLGALALAEIAVLFPRAGGNYAFLTEGYGRFAGFLWGWVEFGIIRSASIAALATMFAEGLANALREFNGGVQLLDFWPQQMLAVAAIAALGTLNALGTRLGGRVQVVLTSIKIGSILTIVALPLVIWLTVPAPSHPPRVSNLTPVWPAEWAAFDPYKFGAALVGVLWAYHGWMNIGPIAGEVRDPGRNIPRALLGGVALLIALYVGANVAYHCVLPRVDIAASKQTAVSTEFALRLLGGTGVVLGSAALMMSVFGSLNGNLLVGPRLLFAMARDRLIPTGIGAVNPSTQTPVLATVVLAAWSSLLIAGVGVLTRSRLPVIELGSRTLDLNLPAGKAPFDVVTDFAMFGAVTFETLVILALFRFRKRFPVNEYRIPYRCPGYPVVPAVYVLVMGAVLYNMFASPDQRAEAYVGLAFIAAGGVVYAFIRRRSLA